LGRNDFNLPLSLVDDNCLEDFAEADLEAFIKENSFTLKMYAELLSQGRIERDYPMIFGRVESGTSIVDCFSAAFGLNTELEAIDKDFFEIHEDWKEFTRSS